MKQPSWDHKLTCAIHGQAGKYKWLDRVMVVIARDLLWVQILGPMVAFFFLDPSVILWMLGVGMMVQAIVMLIQVFIQRERPYARERLPLLFPLQFHTASFPSGHASLSWAFGVSAFWGFLTVGLPVVGALCLLGAGLISFSRVYAELHYVSDVLAGTCIGVIVPLVYLYLLHL